MAERDRPSSRPVVSAEIARDELIISEEKGI
jgi:hypothetical protein